MPKIKKARFAAFIFFLLLAGFIWSLYGLFTSDFSITSLWGIGAGFSLFWLFNFIMLGRVFGYARSFFALCAITLVVFFAMALNSARGWPFGMAVFNDFLGYKLFRIPWPLLLFWSAVINSMLLIKKPDNISNDPKSLFSWAFDASLLVMITSFLIEPLSSTMHAVTWINPGGILNVPFSAFLGWFITAFIASFAGIIVLRPWVKQPGPVHHLLPLSLIGLSILLFAVSVKINIVLVQLLAPVLMVYFLLKYLRLKKVQNPHLLANIS